MEKLDSKTTYIPISCPNIDDITLGTEYKADKVRAMLHQLFLARLAQGAYIGKNKKHPMNYIYADGYVALDSTILRSLLSSSYKKYVSFLIDKRIIQTRASSSSSAAYTPGQSCIHYKINPLLLFATDTKRHFRKEEVTDYCTIKAIIKTAEYYEISNINNARSIALEPIHKKLFSMEKLIRFNLNDIDYWLENLKREDNIDIDFSDEVEKLHAIHDGYFYQKVDVFGNRLYSPLKSVKSELRQFMYFEGLEGEQLSNFDIKNSQLYFLSLLFNPNIVTEFIPEFAPINTIAAKYFDTEDVQAFIRYATNGNIYTKWQNYRGLKTRNLAKNELIGILFSKVTARREGVNEFKELLPNVKAFLDGVKLLTETELPFITKTYLHLNGDYKVGHFHANLSCATQRLESRIFTKLFGQKLLDAKIQPFFTVHDSIYYPNSYSKKAVEVFNQMFVEWDIPKPQIKIQTPFF